MDIHVTHNPAHSRFEVTIDDQLAVCDYRRDGQTLVLPHTLVPVALQGRGVAAQLVRAALEWARAEKLKVEPWCSYVASYMHRHPETRDLLAAP
ncbi:GNAT family N-acetyltransferase [Caldimonas sp. KR1-144]|uniref:GNAT family N-acetyltransferase n=1 Tax=Caldimonas sp. KR1-144 TaxID=3400911 RepID=UPI003C09CF85